jgi:hypothetical protein
MRTIFYFGDGSLTSAASYLAGLMHHWNWPFEHRSSGQDLNESHVVAGSLYIFSDFPAARINAAAQRRLMDCVSQGAGLLMIGGWESFQGAGGNWSGSELAAALPVAMQSADDRVNCDQPVLVRPTIDHPICRGLPWRERPPLIGGYNRIAPKSTALQVLEAQSFRAQAKGSEFEFTADGPPAPLLVVGSFGKGRTAAFASDVAPHWVGPLVDWGPQRVCAQAPGAEAIEVGSCYAQFFRQLLAWVGRFEDHSP